MKRNQKAAAGKTTYLDRPVFKSEREEAEWWDTHPDEVDDFIKRAGKAGAVTRGRLEKAVATSRPTTPVSIRLFTEDLDRARLVAHRKGLKVQTYIKMILHEVIEREGQAR